MQAVEWCTFVILVSLVVLVGAVPAVTRLLISLQPSLPTAAVQSSSITLLNVSSSLIKVRWDLTFSITNPNSHPFFYDRVVAYAADGITGFRHASFNIPTFQQPGRGTTSKLSATFHSLTFVVNDCTRNRTIVGPCGPLQLRLEVEPAAVYDRWTWPHKRNLVEVECDVFKLLFLPATRKLEFGAAACRSDGEWRRLEDKCQTIFWNYVYVAAMCLAILAFSL